MLEKSRLLDVNALAIYLVEDHPGHPYIAPVVDEGLAGRTRLMAPDLVPLRARWVMTSKWGLDKGDTDQALQQFLAIPRVHCVGASRETLLRAFDLARTLGHDVYDTFYLALAEEHGVEGILTTDTDFRKLCRSVGLEYVNPVPPRVLAQFEAYSS